MELRAGGVVLYSSQFDPKTGALVRVVELPKNRWGDTPWEKDADFAKRYERRRYTGAAFSPVPETADIAITDRCSFGCAYCAPPGTYITVKGGALKPIEQVQVDDEILTVDPDTGNALIEPVSEIFVNDFSGDLIELELESGTTLRLTPNHQVFTTNRGWVEAGSLRAEDNVIVP